MISIDVQKRLLALNGIQVEEYSADVWLSLAIDAEEKARLCGPFDPAYVTFITMRNNYEKAAVLAELLASVPA